MKIITKDIDTEKYEVGVIVARFQIDNLHEGHKHLIDFVISNHKKVVIFLGIPKVPNTERNPLDFETRKLMVKSLYPTVEVMPLWDQGLTPKANLQWAKNLDDACKVVFGQTTFLLYGSRDSFIPYYQGQYQTCEIETVVDCSATIIRTKIAENPEDSDSFRRGVIYNCHHLRPTVYPTVDVVVANGEGQILLARKPNETLFRFVGGFVDPTDAHLEMAARRELSEETNLTAHGMKYIASTLVDDWRYAQEKSKIMTTLFLTYEWDQIGRAEASDDIEELKWFDVHELGSPELIEEKIVYEHKELMLIFINKVYKENLILKVQPREWEPPTSWVTKNPNNVK